ncbi:hypothetical protein BAUCODRAFT_137695 [Baudoinia panamericana UAMH 10762]|uniref:O-methyltransferase C-terminal domain-containing protein n=1 Tax=Baudoinia panamericana (strain UAMH 10762) TaxID=717646 RepID=M2N1Q8_BAUPA|nr:uncharacterized protein BAUCODRAFT_137695 [Baudoinia panamericana UAMH 10762]EMC97863.1 hypothetical protein BAUCODRAFT_137695 [Baudoinia panamericana UAMH 10762]
MDTASVISSLSSVKRQNFANDESARVHALGEARALMLRLQRPWERVYDMMWLDPITSVTAKISADMGIFSALSAQPQTSHDLASKTGTDGALVTRFCRLLAARQIIKEDDVDKFSHLEFSEALADPNGVVNGIHHHYDLPALYAPKAPAYFRETKYVNPTDAEHPPWQTLMGSQSFWNYIKDRPSVLSHFQKTLASLTGETGAWTEMYSPSHLLEGYDPATALCVDVGGGLGRDMRHLAEAIRDSHSNAKIIVQDQASVIDVSMHQANPLPSNIELAVHDFFREQPVKGARAYLMHSICHDWPDSTAREILVQLAKAGKAGYSKVLLVDGVVPEKGASPRTAQMDINMMLLFAANERTEKQWRALVEGAGLKFERIWSIEGAIHVVVEASVL